jgi:tetratricopeptide (TPR) repeat protein
LSVAATPILALALLSPVRAGFQANLGAVAQSRAALSVCEQPQWPIQDALRRSPEVNLGPAIARYRAALALDPANAATCRRLGQIEFSLGEYKAARAHLESAYAAAPDQRATRRLLGEAYPIAGEPARAAELWQGIDLSQGQITLRAWWCEQVGEKGEGDELLAAEGVRRTFEVGNIGTLTSHA